MGSSGSCPVCGVKEETTMHILRDCQGVRGAWLLIVDMNRNTHFFVSDLHDWMSDNMKLREWFAWSMLEHYVWVNNLWYLASSK